MSSEILKLNRELNSSSYLTERKTQDVIYGISVSAWCGQILLCGMQSQLKMETMVNHPLPSKRDKKPRTLINSYVYVGINFCNILHDLKLIILSQSTTWWSLVGFISLFFGYHFTEQVKIYFIYLFLGIWNNWLI